MATIITSANQGAFPNVQYFPAEDIIPDALVLQTAELGPAVEGDAPAVRIPFIADDVTAGFVPEGTDIDALDPTLDEITITTRKVAVLTKISSEAYAANGVAGILTNSLRRSVIAKADNAYLTNTGGPIGIANVTGIVDGGALASNLDGFVDLLATLETNGAQPSHIIANPAAWAAVQKLKTATGSNAPLVGAPQQSTERQLLGIPVIINRFAPENTLLVTDRSQTVASVGNVGVATSSDRYFDSDSVAVRVTLRFGFGIIRADRIGKITVGASA